MVRMFAIGTRRSKTTPRTYRRQRRCRISVGRSAIVQWLSRMNPPCKRFPAELSAPRTHATRKLLHRVLFCYDSFLRAKLKARIRTIYEHNTIQYNGKFALKNWQTHCQFNLAHKLKRNEMFKRKMKWEILRIEILLNLSLIHIWRCRRRG